MNIEKFLLIWNKINRLRVNEWVENEGKKFKGDARTVGREGSNGICEREFYNMIALCQSQCYVTHLIYSLEPQFAHLSKHDNSNTFLQK